MPREERIIQGLIFVYAADSGLTSAMIDSARKLLRRKGCSLCAITHGLAGERAEWTAFCATLGVPIDVHHRDDMPADVADLAGAALPCVLARVDGALEPLLGPDVLDRIDGGVAELETRLLTHAAMRGLALPRSDAAGAPRG